MPLLLILLQTAAAKPAPSTGLPGPILTFVAMVAIFYFLIFMPMRRQQKHQKEMLKTLQSGQTVLTSGGIIGTVISINDDTLILKIKPDNLKIQVARSAVTNVVGAEDQVKK